MLYCIVYRIELYYIELRAKPMREARVAGGYVPYPFAPGAQVRCVAHCACESRTIDALQWVGKSPSEWGSSSEARREAAVQTALRQFQRRVSYCTVRSCVVLYCRIVSRI